MLKFSVFFVLLLSTFACSRPWSDRDKQEFTGGCLSRQTPLMGADSARKYCHCLLNKALARYPDANDAKYMMYDTAVVRMAQDCLKGR
jgi:hypothetical protein